MSQGASDLTSSASGTSNKLKSSQRDLEDNLEDGTKQAVGDVQNATGTAGSSGSDEQGYTQAGKEKTEGAYDAVKGQRREVEDVAGEKAGEVGRNAANTTGEYGSAAAQKGKDGIGAVGDGVSGAAGKGQDVGGQALGQGSDAVKGGAGALGDGAKSVGGGLGKMTGLGGGD